MLNHLRYTLPKKGVVKEYILQLWKIIKKG